LRPEDHEVEKDQIRPLINWQVRWRFLDAWEAFSSNPGIELMTLPNARALLLDDQPKLADEAIAKFVERVQTGRKQD